MKKILLWLLYSGLLCAQEENLEQLKAKLKAAKEEQKELKEYISKLEKKIPPENVWKFHFEIGYMDTTGNTNTRSFNTDIKIQKRWWDKHLFVYIFDGQYSKDDGEVSKNKYLTELDYNYDFLKTWKTTYVTGYKKDKFSAFEYQFYTGPGMEYQFFKTKTHAFSMQGNILYALDKRYDNGLKDDYLSARFKGKYFLQLIENLTFDEELSYRTDLQDTQNYFIYSVSKLSLKVYKHFFMNVSYKYDYTNEADENEKYDTTFSVNAVVDF